MSAVHPSGSSHPGSEWCPPRRRLGAGPPRHLRIAPGSKRSPLNSKPRTYVSPPYVSPPELASSELGLTDEGQEPVQVLVAFVEGAKLVLLDQPNELLVLGVVNKLW